MSNKAPKPVVQTFATTINNRSSAVVSLALMACPIREEDDETLTPYVHLTPAIARMVACDLISAANAAEEMKAKTA